MLLVLIGIFNELEFIQVMGEKLVDSIAGYSSKGCKILFGHSGTGNVRIKVKHGPLGVMTNRYNPDLETYTEVKRRLKLRHQSA